MFVVNRNSFPLFDLFILLVPIKGTYFFQALIPLQGYLIVNYCKLHRLMYLSITESSESVSCLTACN